MPEQHSSNTANKASNSFKNIKTLLDNKISLSPDSATEFISLLSNPETPKEQIIELTKAWKQKPETAQDLEFIAQEIFKRIETLNTKFEIYDCCGTGGDKSSSFNISTASAFVAASLGLKIAKHGGRKTSSQSGSIDFLEALNISSSISLKETETILKNTNLAFIASPATHLLLGRWKDICRELEFYGQTGLIGTLTNPLNVSHQVLGVAKPEWGPLMIESLKALGRKTALVVCGEIPSQNASSNFIDEASINGPTHYWILQNQLISSFAIEAKELGLTENYFLEDLTGGSAKENSEIFIELLNLKNKHQSNTNQNTTTYNWQPKLEAIRQAICYSTALLLSLEKASNQDLHQKNIFTKILKQEISRAQEAFEDGKVLDFYEDYKNKSQTKAI